MPLPFRAINALGRLIARRGTPPIDLTPETIIAQAQRETGLTDFGSDDFRQPLNKLVNAYETEANLTLLGRIASQNFLQGILVNRLYLHRYFSHNPTILTQPITRPLFIIGLPRTGTTLLQRLLAQDPQARHLRTWELYNMKNPPHPQHYTTDPRINIIRRQLQIFNMIAPDMQIKHPVGAEFPEECITLLRHTLTSPLMFNTMANIPSYIHWLDQQDMVPVYQYFKAQLQFLNHHFDTTHWILKSPAHLLNPDALLTVFPDASIIQTHRHPQKVLPSWCSLIGTMRGSQSNQVDAHALGQEWLTRWATMTNKTVTYRQQNQQQNQAFLDIYFQDMMNDPISTVRHIYHHFGYNYTPEFEQRMQQWLTTNPRHKHGKHHYTMAEFNLTPDQINHHFAPYLQQHPSLTI
ncbi:MAG TPA: sulfotransferase [Anaerolineae bacterium]|nr:sulfotransferase [Anaerolineae bacterium]